MKTNLLTTLLFVVFFATIANAQTEEAAYYPKLPPVGKEGMSGAKAELAKILMKTEILDAKKGYPRSYPKYVSVLDDRLEMTFKKYAATIYYSDLPGYTIHIVQIKDVKKVITKESPAPVPINENVIRLGDVVFSEYTFGGGVNGDGEFAKLADYLFFFQHQLNVQRYDSLVGLFKPLAAQYGGLKEKPPVSEEQRKYIVQANSLNQQKRYDKAIDLYNKAIEVDQTAYPAAYWYLALLSAQTHNYDAAIYNLKKYLLLEPADSTARSAQDKIYEWEILMQK